MTDTDPPRLLQVTLDCADPDRLAGFWSALLGVELLGRHHQFVHLAAQPGPRRHELQPHTMDGHHWWVVADPRATSSA